MLIKALKIQLLILVTTLTYSFSFAYNHNGQNGSNQVVDHPGEIQNDAQLVDALRSHNNQYYIEAGNLTITKILPEDTSGLPHQKWMAKTSNNDQVQVVYNTDMGDKIPLQVGQKFSVGGQFIWTNQGGLVHWLHDDPKKIRPDGYVYYQGRVYGDTDKEDHN